MKPVLSAKQMKNAEQLLFDTGVPSIDVMEEAAKGFAKTIFESLEKGKKTCVFACGSGGNGGDGYAAARIFAGMGGRAIVLKVFEPKNEDTYQNYLKSLETVFSVIDMSALDSLPRPDAWADCIFGIGLDREVGGNAKRAIERINHDRKNGVKVFSCDIPSGLHTDTGEIMGMCVKADKTVTFEFLKFGHLLGSGMDVCGEISVHPIGIGEERVQKDCAKLIQKRDLLNLLPERKRTAHKNNFGHLLIVAGSFGMAGACCIAANAAMRTGAGLVSVFCPASIVPIVQTLAPCAMCIPAEENDGALGEKCLARLNEAMKGKNAIAVGPGLSLRASKEVIDAVLTSGIPAVIDADGLNLISRNEDLLLKLSASHALTPHPGEAVRLINEHTADSVKMFRNLEKLGAKVLLKGAATLIGAENQIYISASGTNGMAKGGSGDALTGMVGAFLAMGLDTEKALICASELHGIAGECASKKFGNISMLPTDLVNCIGDAYEEIYR